MRKNARILNAFILTILLLGVIVFAIKLGIVDLKYREIDNKYKSESETEIKDWQSKTEIGDVDSDLKLDK